MDAADVDGVSYYVPFGDAEEMRMRCVCERERVQGLLLSL